MLSDRQFVVAKDKLSEAELQLQKELFWYREALFKSLRGHWKEVRNYLLEARREINCVSRLEEHG
jgi:hypothetical protein